MKRILVPTDFADCSIFAIRTAAELVEKFHSELLLLHVVDEPEKSDVLAEKVDTIMKMAELHNLNYHYQQITGDLIETIVSQPSDLIVMGSEGAHGLESFFVGTNAEKVAKRAECPVLVVKANTTLVDLKKIVFPTNMKREDDDMIDQLKFLQQHFDSKVHIVKAFDDTLTSQLEVEKRLTDFAEFHKIPDYVVTAIPGIDEGEVIIDYAEKEGADIILLATHHHHGLEKIFAGHISSEVINESNIPIWTRSIELPSL
ncbi:universal stress protein [Marinoscillum pacificum]|uniref:universal stress protein n=1 Tax=Marinoscillum pacificum TaxID=392723 RepID=UPI002158504B|nr:universal stress protein [Marinoscillum pacificum]